MFLLDTSVLTRLNAPPIRQRIEELDSQGLARTTMTTRDRLLGTQPDEWDVSTRHGAFCWIDVEEHHFDEGRQVEMRWPPRDEGRQGARSLIAAVAEVTSLTVAHYDVDFYDIATVTDDPRNGSSSVDRSTDLMDEPTH